MNIFSLFASYLYMLCFAGIHYNEEKWLVYAPCFYFFISRLLCNLIRAVYSKSRKNIQNTKKGYHNIYITAYEINYKVHIISTEKIWSSVARDKILVSERKKLIANFN